MRDRLYLVTVYRGEKIITVPHWACDSVTAEDEVLESTVVIDNDDVKHTFERGLWHTGWKILRTDEIDDSGDRL